MPVSGSPGALARAGGALVISGALGATGATGATGAQGAWGAQGALGAQGAQGAQGASVPEDKQLEDQLVELLDQKQFDRAVPVAERLVALRQQTTRAGSSDYALARRSYLRRRER